MAKEMQVPPSAALPGEAPMLGQRRGNLSGVQGINILETAYVKDKMDLFSLGPDPAKPICYRQNHWRKTWDRNRALVKCWQLCGWLAMSSEPFTSIIISNELRKAAQAEHQSPKPFNRESLSTWSAISSTGSMFLQTGQLGRVAF